MEHMGKKLLALLLATVFCLGLFPSAARAEGQEGEISLVEEQPPEGEETLETIASGVCGEALTWTLDGDGVLTISGTGEMWNWERVNYGTPNTPWQEHLWSVTAIVVEEGVTGIGNCAFYGCEDCASVMLPEGLTRIGVEGFSCCSGLRELAIPQSVTAVGDYAFSYCSRMKSIRLPESLSGTGLLPFDNCTALEEIRFTGSRSAWEALGMDYDRYRIQVHCAEGDVPLADPARCGDALTWTLEGGTLTVSGEGEMWNFSYGGAPWYSPESSYGIKSVHLEKGISSIGAGAFRDCRGIISVTIPESVLAVGAHAFHSCTGLTEISLPGGTCAIGAGAFSGTGLRRAEIPGTVKRVDAGAFAFCSRLTEIRFAGSAPVFGAGFFPGGDVFSGLTATAYYPDNDPAWTEDIRQNYGGNITWVGYTPERKPGDINGDNTLDNKDVTRLIRYIKYHDVDVAEESLDVNGDGELNNKDVTRLIRYIKYGDVEIH